MWEGLHSPGLEFWRALKDGDIEGAVKLYNTALAGIPYQTSPAERVPCTAPCFDAPAWGWGYRLRGRFRRTVGGAILVLSRAAWWCWSSPARARARSVRLRRGAEADRGEGLFKAPMTGRARCDDRGHRYRRGKARGRGLDSKNDEAKRGDGYERRAPDPAHRMYHFEKLRRMNCLYVDKSARLRNLRRGRSVVLSLPPPAVRRR